MTMKAKLQESGAAYHMVSGVRKLSRLNAGALLDFFFLFGLRKLGLWSGTAHI